MKLDELKDTKYAKLDTWDSSNYFLIRENCVISNTNKTCELSLDEMFSDKWIPVTDIDFSQFDIVSWSSSCVNANKGYLFPSDDTFIYLNNVTDIATYESNLLSLRTDVLDNVTTIIMNSNCKDYIISAFSYVLFNNVTDVILNEHISSLFDYIFKNFKKLESIDLSNISSLGESSFEGCSHLGVVKFSDNLKYIPSRCFLDCYALSKCSLPKDCETAEDAFYLWGNIFKKKH